MSDQALVPPSRVELGLVCITRSDAVRYRTITRSRYLALPEAERAGALERLYAANLERLDAALSFCARHDIRLYRVTSNLFPMADLDGDDTGRAVLEGMRARLAAVGPRAAALGIRVVMHPDQFVVLSSEDARVVRNSVRALEFHAFTFDALGLPRSTWAAMNLHGGKGGRADALVDAVAALPEAVRSRLTFENDERAYGAAAILDVCVRAGVPMVFDAHHHVVRERLSSFEDPSVAAFVRAARDTWRPAWWQIAHVSNGREGLGDARHHDVVAVMPSSFAEVPWVEVEAKAKEEAVLGLRASWPPASAAR